MNRFSDIIIEHFSSPKGIGRLSAPDSQAFIGSPVCGDQILLSARIDSGRVTKARFEARGCATSLALGSILTAELPGCELPGWDLRRCESVSPEDIAKLMGGLKPEQQHVGQLGAELVRRLAKNYRNGVLDDDTPIPAR